MFAIKPAIAGFLLFGRLNVFAFCYKPTANEYVFEYMKVRVLEMYSSLPRGAELSFVFHLQGFSPRNLKVHVDVAQAWPTPAIVCNTPLHNCLGLIS